MQNTHAHCGYFTKIICCKAWTKARKPMHHELISKSYLWLIWVREHFCSGWSGEMNVYCLGFKRSHYHADSVGSATKLSARPAGNWFKWQGEVSCDSASKLIKYVPALEEPSTVWEQMNLLIRSTVNSNYRLLPTYKINGCLSNKSNFFWFIESWISTESSYKRKWDLIF